MPPRTILIVALGGVVVYAVLVATLLVAGRRTQARAVAGFVPDCVVLMRRILGDPRVPGRRKVLVAVAVGYLAMPIDIVPDFLPIVGQADDAIVVALVLRAVLRGAGAALLEEHWPGPAASLALVRRAAFGRAVQV